MGLNGIDISSWQENLVVSAMESCDFVIVKATGGAGYSNECFRRHADETLAAGKLLGWTSTDSVFLGGMLSMSSTTIIIKAFDDLGLRNQRFTSLVFGVLVVEDLFAVVLMVLFSTLFAQRAEADHFINAFKPYIGKAIPFLDWEADALNPGPS